MERKVEDIVDKLKRAKYRGKGCSLLIGAGCSQTAGIPTAGEIVKEIQRNCPREYERAEKKTYPCCMAQLSPGERRDLIDNYVRQAKVNWGHIAIAQLMKEGYIERVLTTNFDPLVVRACALLGLFPAIYDFAASRYYKRAFIPTPAVFYLHGQHTGFVLMNTEEECASLSELLEWVFKDVTQGRVWIVAGYSGENDPVFDHLANMEQFDEELYWIGYRDNEPPRHVREKLLSRDKYAYYVRGFDADDFFVTLAQKLKCFPPTFVSQPFTHLNQLMEMITPYKLPGEEINIKVPENTQKLIQKAINRFEQQSKRGKDFLELKEAAATGELEESSVALESYLMAGDYERVIAEGSQIKEKTPEIKETIAWAYIGQGNTLQDQANTKSGVEADSLFAQAGEKYQAALAIKPDKYEALNNWGNTLSNQAKTKTGAEADSLFDRAGEKYQAALAIKSDNHEVLNNWGNVLSSQAKTKTGAEANSLFVRAGEKYQAALAIKSDNHDALNSWGVALSAQARVTKVKKAKELIQAAYNKFSQAEVIQPGIGSYNLACISAIQGDLDDCRRWLQKCLEYNTLPDKNHLMTDSDLDNVRNCDWFQELIKGLE